MLEFSGPIKPSFFLSLDEPSKARLSGPDGAARLRVMRSTGYPYDLRVVADQASTLHAGRVFAPVVDQGASLRIETDADAHLRFFILCANCFTEMWAKSLPSASVAAVDAAHDEFWDSDELRDCGCPNCFAAAAKPH